MTTPFPSACTTIKAPSSSAAGAVSRAQNASTLSDILRFVLSRLFTDWRNPKIFRITSFT
jgi:hypothetical protein